MYDILIIGGGAAGLTAALYSLRAGKRVLVLEAETFGGQITASPCVENYPGLPQVSGAAFADALLEQVLQLGGQVELERVTEIRTEGDHKRILTEDGEYLAQCVILATGVRHRKLGLEREDELLGRGLSYCAICDGAFFKGKETAVVGGGSAALQSALLLAGICGRVYLIHRRDAFRGEAALVRQVEKTDNIVCLMERRIMGLLGEQTLSGLRLQSTRDEKEETLSIDGLFVSIGQEPSNQLFASVVKLDKDGYILAGEDCRTSDPVIFAAGDCRAKEIRQLTTAAADGSVAALAACGTLEGL